MMNLKNIELSASNLGNMVRAGIALNEIAQRLAIMQPDYADFWKKTALSLQSGHMLSESLQEVWPEEFVKTVVAGEHSGRMDEVFERITETIAVQQTIRATMMKLSYPVGMGLGGFGAFILYMAIVIPSLMNAFGSVSRSGSGSGVLALSMLISRIVHDYWQVLLGGSVVGLIVLVNWLQTPAAKQTIINVGLTIPVAGNALRDMFFGLWAYYMALMSASGVTTPQGLTLTAATLPESLRDGVLAFEKDLTIHNKRMDESANPQKLPMTDPRQDWPFFICNAFMVAEQTGDVSKELLRVAPALVKQGIKSLERFINVVNVIVLAAAAAMIVTPMAAYYVQVFSSLQHAGR